MFSREISCRFVAGIAVFSFTLALRKKRLGAHMEHPGLCGLHRPSNHFVHISSMCLAILLCQFDRKRERDKINIDWPINRRPLSDIVPRLYSRDQSLSLCDIVILVHRLDNLLYLSYHLISIFVISG